MDKDPPKKPTDQKTQEASTRSTDTKQRSGSDLSRQDATSPTNPGKAFPPPPGYVQAGIRNTCTAQKSEARQDSEMHDEIEEVEEADSAIIRSETG